MYWFLSSHVRLEQVKTYYEKCLIWFNYRKNIIYFIFCTYVRKLNEAFLLH